MGKAKKTRKFAVAKKIISPKDTLVKSVAAKAAEKKEKEAKKAEPRQVEQGVSALFFQYNTQLGELFHWILGRIAFVEILCHRSSSHFPLLGSRMHACAPRHRLLCITFRLTNPHLRSPTNSIKQRPTLSCPGRYEFP